MRLGGSRPRLVLSFALLSLGCSEAEPARPTRVAEARYEPLVELDGWSGVAREDDPFLESREPLPPCAVAGYRWEADQQWLELDTGACSWVTVTASSSHAIDVGQMLKLRISHYDLDAAAPAEAALELRIGECRVWSEVISIPSPARVEEEELASPCAHAENAPVFFHVHNHGQNTYQLQGLELLR